MSEIDAAKVKELRERTGAGMMDCKRALEECGGDVEKAVLALREAGLAAAAKKAYQGFEAMTLQTFIEAAMPGRWAAPPAPAMITLRPRPRAPVA